MTRIAVVSDTHDFVSETVLSYVRTCDYTLHAGDVCTEYYADKIRMNCRNVYFVRGNNDGEWASLIRKEQFFAIDGVTFFMVHNIYDMRRSATAWMNYAKVVITGHTHIYQLRSKNKQIWLNPGSCTRGRDGNTTMAILTLESGRVTVKKIIL